MSKGDAVGFEITVLTGAEEGPFGLENELRHVKAALLYADRVRLVSPKMAILDAFTRINDGSDSEFLDRMLRLVVPLAPSPEILEVARILHRQKGRQRSPALIALDAQMRRELAPAARAEMQRAIEGFRTEPGVDELYRARDAGVLELDGLGLDPVAVAELSLTARAKGRYLGFSKDYATRLLERVVEVIGPSEDAYPLFDAQMMDLVRKLDALRDRQAVGRAATEPHLAALFMGKMDSFPDARMDEILDVRRELNASLVRFRSAVAGMAREMQETPLDDGFKREASALYRERVAPAILEIHEIEKERGLFRQIARQATLGEAKPDVSATIATIGLAATQYSSLPSLATAIAGLSGPTLSSAYRLLAAVKRERDRLDAERRKNKFVFLIEADRKLSERKE
jgi:hypothetical protein